MLLLGKCLKFCLQLLEKPAYMKSVTHSVMDLYGKGEQRPAGFLIKFAHGENRQEVVVPLLEVQLKAVESVPRNHGDVKHVVRTVRLADHAEVVAVSNAV